eukprot:3875112-Rhodomonas_salina.1
MFGGHVTHVVAPSDSLRKRLNQLPVGPFPDPRILLCGSAMQSQYHSRYPHSPYRCADQYALFELDTTTL